MGLVAFTSRPKSIFSLSLGILSGQPPPPPLQTHHQTTTTPPPPPRYHHRLPKYSAMHPRRNSLETSDVVVILCFLAEAAVEATSGCKIFFTAPRSPTETPARATLGGVRCHAGCQSTSREERSSCPKTFSHIKASLTDKPDIEVRSVGCTKQDLRRNSEPA